ncbi:MAG: homocysteine S-methyltransferase family protein [Lachnospiraceae bacterium]|nr:homocysteine S-methyltransferase family protein [Lachnospiraceae bacterium]
MKKLNFSELLNKGIIVLDGATGTNLQEAGMPTGVCPEAWIFDHPQELLRLQKAYVEAGSQILYAPTFTANRLKLAEFSEIDRLVEINRRMVALSREAAGGRAYVAGDLTMTGRQLSPVGDLGFEELVDIYKEQVAAILEEGVDLFVVETMMSLAECRAAVLAIKETCDLPIMVSLTYNENGRTLFGSLPETTMVVLQAMGVDVVGINCAAGPEALLPAISSLRKVAKIPILAKPNAGLPVLRNGKTVYDMTPEAFASAKIPLVEAGASVVGGCCGTTPAHIRALKVAVSSISVEPPDPIYRSVLTSERKNVVVDPDGCFQIIGERINPTGKKAFAEELRSGRLDMAKSFAKEQERDGAAILDVNMGTNGIDEKEMMVRAIEELTFAVDLPLCIDSSYTEVIEAALRIYPGRALINSISAEKEKLQKLLPIAKKYGAMFILLPLSDTGLPKTMEEKHNNIHTILKEAESIGISKDDCIVDLLVSTIGADAAAAKKCFVTAAYCKEELGLPTVCGLSNISFGLPQRSFVNTAFLVMALSAGLTMAIANPSQTLMKISALAGDMLLDKPKATDHFLDMVPSEPLTILAESEIVRRAGSEPSAPGQPAKVSPDTDEAARHPIIRAVVQGDVEGIVPLVKAEIEQGTTASDILNNYLINGINTVGDYYESGKYFLPQLISGANAMKEAMEYLEPMLSAGGVEEKECIVIATVEGDIHDIGKNLVVLMLKNYGYRVVDLGKDVPAKEIVDRAKEEQAAVIGLSALMTTTMMRMKEVVELARADYPQAKVVIGGACITAGFAKEIGADGYSEDAAGCVRLVKELL